MELRFASLLAVSWLAASSVGAADQDLLERQRAAFREAYEAAEYGRWEVSGDIRSLLGPYVLFPDLRAAWLRARIDTVAPAEVEQFIEAHPHLPAALELRRHWLASLERRGDWTRFLALYDAHFRDEADARLRCVALQARQPGDADAAWVAEALDLWMSGSSRPDACDPVFTDLRERGVLTEALYRDRFELAIEARQIPLARYLARGLGESDRNLVERWARMQDRPAGELARLTLFADSPGDRELIRYGIERLNREDPLEADATWRVLREEFSFEREARDEISRDIALLAAYRHLPEADALLEALGDAATTPEVTEWRIRLAALAGDWEGVLASWEALPDAAAADEVWLYWRARALEATGETTLADQIFAALAAERSYHGFLAADRLDIPYAYAHRPIEPDEAVIAAIAARPELIRARELFFVGLDSRGRGEWNAEMERLDAAQCAQASVLAHRWGWHSRAIATAAQAGILDDLEIRYPTPFRDAFDSLAAQANVSTTWAYGVARSESLFMPDVASGAGALGIMQLLPSTGRETARKAELDYDGSASLLDPRVNIALGTRYLGAMHERFGGSQVLATAAYNAGPNRVLDWLPAEGTVAADAWIDAIPFGETRDYVQRVLSAEAIFYWRMHGDTQRLSDLMTAVQPLDTLDSRLASGEQQSSL
ncbi:MAG: transglycosylase SLT domain-containing protein [Gammaproteobacteria bacterium]